MSGEEGTGMVPVVGAAARARRGPARGGWRLAAGEHSVPRSGGVRPAPPPPATLPPDSGKPDNYFNFTFCWRLLTFYHSGFNP